MKGYKVVYFRVGDKESWAGWRIAGMTEGVPADAKESFSKNQSSNSTPSLVNDLYTAAPIIWEMNSDNKYVYFSKLTYGIIDQGNPGRQSMRADGVILPLLDNSDINEAPESILALDSALFNNRLIIEDVYPQKVKNNESTDSLPENEIVTVFNMVNVSHAKINSAELINKYFSNKTVFSDLIKCIYWALTDKSSPSVNIIYEGDAESKKEIISLIMSYLPLNMRLRLSFRTQHVPAAKPMSVVFSNVVDMKERFFEIATGRNNIIKEFKLDTRLAKYDFIDYTIDNKDNVDINEYYSLLNKGMAELGVSNDIDLNLIKVAHEIVMDEFIRGQGEVTDLDVLKRLYNFLMLPYNNEKVDGYCAKLLETIIDRKIELNESIQERLQAKLKVTVSEKLKSIGYNFNAILMVKSNNRHKEFVYLHSLEGNKELYDLMISNILAIEGGDKFIDEYFGNYYGDLFVKKIMDLKQFYIETKKYFCRKNIEEFIYKKCKEYGVKFAHKALKHEPGYVDEFEKFERMLDEIAATKKSAIIIETQRYFWDIFDLKEFDVKDKAIYQKLFYRSHQKYAFVHSLLHEFDTTRTPNVNSIKKFSELLDGRSYPVDAATKTVLLKKYQMHCVSFISKNKYLNLWLQIANLTKKDAVKFILDQQISVFTNTEILDSELENAKFSGKIDLITETQKMLETHVSLYGEDQRVTDMLKVLAPYTKSLKKLEKEIRKEKEKEKPIPMEYGDRNRSTGAKHFADNKEDKSSDSKGLFSKFFKKK